jgi:hypothetical protein
MDGDMALQDAIDFHGGAWGDRAGDSASTPKNTAVAAVYRLLAALREFGPDDRRDIRELLELELAESLA